MIWRLTAYDDDGQLKQQQRWGILARDLARKIYLRIFVVIIISPLFLAVVAWWWNSMKVSMNLKFC